MGVGAGRSPCWGQEGESGNLRQDEQGNGKWLVAFRHYFGYRFDRTKGRMVMGGKEKEGSRMTARIFA